MMCLAKMVAVSLSLWTLVIGVPATARVAAAEPTIASRAIDALKEAGALAAAANALAGQENANPDEKEVRFLETNEAVLKTLPVLWKLPHPEKVTLTLVGLQPHHVQELASHAPFLGTLKAVVIQGGRKRSSLIKISVNCRRFLRCIL